MITSPEILAELPVSGPWASHAIALAWRGDPLDGLPEPLAVLGTSAWSFDVGDTDGDQPEAPWVAARCASLEPRQLAVARAHGITASEVCWFAHNEHGPYPQGLLAAWEPGDRDAVIHVLWADGMGRDEANVTELGRVEPWLQGLLRQLLKPESDGPKVKSPRKAALRQTLHDAFELRTRLYDQLTALVAELEQRASTATGGPDDDAILTAWDAAARRLARINSDPWLWSRV